ncbi:MAG: S46 family peptidase, partial [Luteibaculum sp.]
HTGDFSMFRIYADANNEPAEYSPSNVPFKPKKYLPISMQGSDDGDFAMVYGFPGRTEHFLSSSEVEFVTEELNPMRISMRDASLEVINEAMLSSDKLRIQYAAKQSGVSNAWKKWRGQSRGLRMFNAVDKKKAFEEEYVKRAKKAGKENYVEALNKLLSFHEDFKQWESARANFIELVYVGSELLRFAYDYQKLVELSNSDAADTLLQQEKEKLLGASKGHFKDYNAEVDKQILLAQLPLYKKHMPVEFQVGWAKFTSEGEMTKWVNKLYDKTIFTKEEELQKILASAGDNGVKKIEKDQAFKAMKELYSTYFGKIAPEYQVKSAEKEALMKLYVEGILDLFPEIDHWPDANSTLRLSYGKVEGSQPTDAVIYEPQTTSGGILAKYIPGDRDFDLPNELIELLEERDFGPYANKDDELVVCFTSSNHTSGGNSGSPVINGKGELIGLNFDRSWESTMSDIMFDPDICRNIAVDMRYILFIVDKYAQAGHLIDEMELVSSAKK